jgi:hypothetical protein
VGRRRVLTALGLLGAAGGVLVLLAPRGALVGVAAFLGMLNGMGRDRGASMILDQVILPTTTTSDRRTTVFAAYNVVQDAGHALGALLAAVPALIRALAPVGEIASLRMAVGLYSVLLLATAVLYRGLSPAVEAGRRAERARLSPETRKIVTRISALFTLDSLGGGFLTTALLSLFFYERFHVSEAVVGALFFGARSMNALSHMAAAWLAKRIGLVNTMVFTHLPSSLLLVTVAYVPSFPVAAALFLLREGLVEMDVPTRQSFVLAIVRPEERTFASGVTNLVRLCGWATAPLIAGPMMDGVSLGMPLAVGAAMKIAYDLLLWRSFRRVRAEA